MNAPSGPYLVVSDFDGTITLDDLTNLIWDLHVPYDWRNVLTPLSRDGVLTPLQMIARGYGDVAQPPDVLLAEVMPRGRWRAGFEAFVATCDARRWPLEVLSHGLTFYIRPLLPAGVALTAFEGRFEAGRWRVELPPGVDVPAGRDFKAHVVAALRARHPGHTTVYLGDGRLDFPAARTCDLVFAVRDSTLARMCVEARVPFTPFESFDEVATLLTAA
ncbi:MAG TPA: haloacid dehalogenase-like hydrolase [Polyangia bacterium]|nr:haloacid dehalogenase-like hydrolase [Polyangia bacterium]